MRRTLTDCQKRVVAARQLWRCSCCRVLLTSANQVHHTVALCDGGEDAISNASAMCPNCHALKTQREHLARTAQATDTALEYTTREDRISNGTATCSRCHQTRAQNRDHPVCHEIEMPGARIQAVRRQLQLYAFAPRTSHDHGGGGHGVQNV